MTATPEQPVPASEAQPNGLDPAVSCWCQPEGPPHSKACPMHESRNTAPSITVPRKLLVDAKKALSTASGSFARGVWCDLRDAIDGEQSSESRTNAHLAAPRDAARADQGEELLNRVERALQTGASHAWANCRNAHFQGGKDEYRADAEEVEGVLAALREARSCGVLASEPVAYASSKPERINQLLSVRQYRSCLPKNRVDFDIPLYARMGKATT